MKKMVICIVCVLLGYVCAFAAEEKTQPSEQCEDAVFSGSVVAETFQSIIKNLILPCMTKSAPVRLLISSGGGDVDAAISTYDAVKMYGAQDKLATIAVGTVGSSSVLIYLAGNKREITPNGFIFLHPITNSMEANKKALADELEFTVKLFKSVTDSYVRIVAERTKLSPEQVRDFMTKGVVLNAEEAVKYGFAQNIVGK
ncbi:MAG: ATP-dependent Clp protease proteolytic subunit [Parcubacteria group bacterium]